MTRFAPTTRAGYFTHPRARGVPSPGNPSPEMFGMINDLGCPSRDCADPELCLHYLEIPHLSGTDRCVRRYLPSVICSSRTLSSATRSSSSSDRNDLHGLRASTAFDSSSPRGSCRVGIGVSRSSNRDDPPPASPRIPAFLANEKQVCRAAPSIRRDDRTDSGDGRQEPSLGRRAYPLRATQARHSRLEEVHHPEVHPAGTRHPPTKD